MRRIHGDRRSIAQMMVLVVASLAAACSSSSEEPGTCSTPPDCPGCASDGNCCFSTKNCAPGSICNTEDDELYQSGKPALVCVRVACSGDRDCESGQKCGIDRVCNAPVCQQDSECSSPTVCLDGSCKSPPAAAQASSCAVVSRSVTLLQGKEVSLYAIAKNAAGDVLPTIAFDWSSQAPAIVAVADGKATAVAPGAAQLTAVVRGNTAVTCAGSVTVTSVAPLADNQVRVVLVADDSGAPLSGVDVAVEANGSFSGTTDAAGVVTFAATAPIASVTVQKTGWQPIAVLEPGTRDVFLPVPRKDRNRETDGGGVRGVVDLASTKKGDLKLGFVSGAVPLNLLDFDFGSLIGQQFEARVNVAGFDETIDLPGGVVGGLQAEKDFTADGSGTRCAGINPKTEEAGCFVVPAAAGRALLWSIGGRLKIADVIPIIQPLLDSSDDDSGINVGSLLKDVLPIVRGLNHGVESDVGIEPRPLLENGDPDYANFVRQDLALSQSFRIRSKVTVPTLPSLPGSGAACAGAVVVAAAAIVPSRGIVPLGLTAGLDVLAAGTPDCKVAGAEKPFGGISETLPDGVVGLSSAPLHSGLERSNLALISAALDPDSLAADGGNVQVTALIKRVTAINENESITGPYLPYPAGRVRSAQASVSLNQRVEGAVLVRVEVDVNGGDNWLIYAPASQQEIQFPSAGPAAGADIEDAYLSALAFDGSYQDMWTFGSLKTLDRLADEATGFALQVCRKQNEGEPTPACLIE